MSVSSTSSTSRDPNQDVIVIGGGLAGLSCAKMLQEGGVNVTVLEANTRLGGRVYTVDDGRENPIEMGANWIHGCSKKNPLHQYTTKTSPVKLEGVVQPETSISVYKGNDKVGFFGSLQLGYKIVAFEKIYDGILREAFSGNNDVPTSQIFEQAAQKMREHYPNDEYAENAIELTRVRIQMEEGAKLEEKSGHGYTSLVYDPAKPAWELHNYEEYKGDDLFVTNGMSQVVEHLAKGLQIEKEMKVVKIEQLAGRVKLTLDTPNGRVERTAAKVVVTAPVAVLASQAIEFSPTLSEKKVTAIGSMKQGSVLKVALTFDKRYWDNTHTIVLGNNDLSEVTPVINIQAADKKNNTLVAWFVSDDARAFKDQSDDAIVNHVLQQLGARYPLCNREHLVHSECKNWDNDPLAQGAWSYLPVGSGLESVLEFQKPEGNIYFAGEHTELSFGTMHAAIESGERVAKQLLK